MKLCVVICAYCRQKLDEANRGKESELVALRQHISTFEQQLANCNIVSVVHSVLVECFYMPLCKLWM